MTVIPLTYEEDIYPESDGQPMAETDRHRDELLEAVAALKLRYERDDEVYVSGNLLFYYQSRNPRVFVSPDIFIVRGVPKTTRTKYLLWKEGQVPCFVLELTSRSTQREDFEGKMDLYQQLGVQEYFLFDPQSEYLEPPLQGFRLVGGSYRPIRRERDGSLWSVTTDLLLRQEGRRLRLLDASTGEPLLWTREWVTRAREEAARAKQERARAKREKIRADEEAAAREAAEARAEREAAARKAAEARAEREAAAREAAAALAQQEAARTAAMKQEVERLRRELDRRGDASSHQD